MTFSLAALLIDEAGVPASARAALRAARRAPESERRALLRAAACSLYREANLELADALELVGLLD